MKIIVTGKQVDIGENLKVHIESETRKIVDKYFGDILEVHANISKSNLSKDSFRFHTDLSFHVSRHFTVQSHMEDMDPYRSFNLALEKMESRIQRYRSRLRDTKRHGGALEKEIHPASSYVISGAAEALGEGDNPVIIAEMGTQIPTVSVSDAVMQMDLSDQPIMMFRNAGSGHFNVVYRRPDGNIGWIDPATISV